MDKKNLGQNFNEFLQEEEALDKARESLLRTFAATDVDPIKGEVEATPPFPKLIDLSELENIALKAVLTRDWTCRPVHEGLRQLLSLSHGESQALLEFLNRI